MPSSASQLPGDLYPDHLDLEAARQEQVDPRAGVPLGAARSPLYGLLIALLWVYRTTLVRSVRVLGRENIETGARILVSNHARVSDAFLLPFIYHRRVHGLAQEESFSLPVLGRLLKHAGQIPVRRGTGSHAALVLAQDFLEMDEHVLIYPEGRAHPRRRDAPRPDRRRPPVSPLPGPDAARRRLRPRSQHALVPRPLLRPAHRRLLAVRRPGRGRDWQVPVAVSVWRRGSGPTRVPSGHRSGDEPGQGSGRSRPPRPRLMRLALISQTYPPMVSGISMAVCQLAEGLAERGHQVLVLAASERGKPHTDDTPNLRLTRLRSFPTPLRVGQRWCWWQRRRSDAPPECLPPGGRPSA